MQRVGLNLGQDCAAAIAESLSAAGFELVDESPDILVLEAREMELDEVLRHVRLVVEGGGVIFLCGGRGPLQAAFHLTPGEAPVHGPAEPAAQGLGPVDLDEALPLTGVGYALYRIGNRCVALAGPRGAGWIGCVASPVPALVVSSLRWVCEMRSHRAGTGQDIARLE